MTKFECECFNCGEKFIVNRNGIPNRAIVTCPKCGETQERHLAWDKVI